MAWGLHWEWRGFGTVSAAFGERFAQLDPYLEAQAFEDVYVWAPALSANIKIRIGADDSLKFKWLRARQRPFELWEERAQDLFSFPLQREAWELLAASLGECEIAIGTPPNGPLDRKIVTSALEKAGCRLVLVRKRRNGRIWAVVLRR